jgi:hypothetical protein
MGMRKTIFTIKQLLPRFHVEIILRSISPNLGDNFCGTILIVALFCHFPMVFATNHSEPNISKRFRRPDYIEIIILDN